MLKATVFVVVITEPYRKEPIFYTLEVVYIFWIVYTSICDNMWFKWTSSG